MTTLDAIVLAMVAALNADLGGGYNLSGADQVKEGAYEEPPGSRAFACVLVPRQTAGVGDSRDRFYVETHQIEVRLWAPIADTRTTTQSQASRALAARAKVAMDNARHATAPGTALGRCIGFVCTATEMQPASPDHPADWAFAALLYETVHRRASGT